MKLKKSTKRKRAYDRYYSNVRPKKAARRYSIINGFASRKRGWSDSGVSPADELRRRILLPKQIGIQSQTDRSMLVSAIKKLHEAMQRRIEVVLDFTDTERVFPSGMILLYAEIRNAQNIYRDVPITIHCPSIRRGATRHRKAKVREVLKQIGLFDFLGHKAKVKTVSRDVVHWKFAHGTEADGERLYSAEWGSCFPDNISQKVYGGLMEAATNCSSHAYSYRMRELSRVDRSKEAWWLFSHIKDGRIFLAFCDLGIGIPESLPLGKSKKWWNRIFQTKDTWTDSEKIAEGTKLGLTTTKKKNRGKGLNSIIRLAETNEQAKIMILSNFGAYEHSQKGQKLYAIDFDTSISGTIICMSFPIQQRNR